MDDDFRDIPFFDGRYQINRSGVVVSLARHGGPHIMSHRRVFGKASVQLTHPRDRSQKYYTVTTLIKKAFSDVNLDLNASDNAMDLMINQLWKIPTIRG